MEVVLYIFEVNVGNETCAHFEHYSATCKVNAVIKSRAFSCLLASAPCRISDRSSHAWKCLQNFQASHTIGGVSELQC